MTIGKYTFYLVAVPTGTNPQNRAAWLGYAITPIIIQCNSLVANNNPVIGSNSKTTTNFSYNNYAQVIGATTKIAIPVSDPDGDIVTYT